MSDRSATSLTQFAASMRDPDPDGARKAAAELFHMKHIVVIFPGDCAKLDAMFVEAIASRLYGKHKHG